VILVELKKIIKCGKQKQTTIRENNDNVGDNRRRSAHI